MADQITSFDVEYRRMAMTWYEFYLLWPNKTKTLGRGLIHIPLPPHPFTTVGYCHFTCPLVPSWRIGPRGWGTVVYFYVRWLKKKVALYPVKE